MISFEDCRFDQKECQIHCNSGSYLHLEGRFLPKSDWKEVSCSPKLLKADRRDEETVYLIDTHPSVRDFFREDIQPKLVESNSEERSQFLWTLANQALDSLRLFSKVTAKEMYTHELMINPPHLDSTSYDYENGRFIGLHIDTHQSLSLHERGKGFQLCGINLGESERYFYFIDLTVEEMYQKLGITEFEEYSKIKKLTEKFLSSFPDYPIYRVTIKPNQAYLALTQNIIHDGASNQQGNPDISFFLAGYFSYDS